MYKPCVHVVVVATGRVVARGLQVHRQIGRRRRGRTRERVDDSDERRRKDSRLALRLAAGRK